MKLSLEQRLLFTTVELHHAEQSVVLARVLVDTGSAATIFQTELLKSIGLIYAPEDEVHEVFGVGSSELVFQKGVDTVICGDLIVRDFSVEAGWLDYGIQLNGIIGLDFLLATRAVIGLGLLAV